MIYTRTDDLELCKKYDINPSQLLMIKLYVEDPEVSDEKTEAAEFMKNLYKFTKLFGYNMEKIPRGKEAKEKHFEQEKWFKENIAQALVDKSILIAPKAPAGHTAGLDCFEISPQFIQDFAIDLYGMPDELFEAYPKFFMSNGTRYNIRNSHVEKFGAKYLRFINNQREKHEEVLELIEWAKENKSLNIGLEKFVDTKYWEALQELKEEGGEAIGFSTELV